MDYSQNELKVAIANGFKNRYEKRVIADGIHKFTTIKDGKFRMYYQKNGSKEWTEVTELSKAKDLEVIVFGKLMNTVTKKEEEHMVTLEITQLSPNTAIVGKAKKGYINWLLNLTKEQVNQLTAETVTA